MVLEYRTCLEHYSDVWCEEYMRGFIAWRLRYGVRKVDYDWAI